MRISEAAELTGLSISNIRFYEKKGLLEPVRSEESKYRNYSQEDIRRMKLIVLYRKMNLSIETIYLLLQGEVQVEAILERQEEELVSQMNMLQGSINLCRKIRREASGDENLQNIDVDYYLNYVREEEESGKQFAQIDEFLEDFSDFTGLTSCILSPLRADIHTGRFFSNIWVVRGISALFLILCIVIPAERIVNIWMQEGPVEHIAFWAVWFGGFSYAFWQFRKRTRS